MQQRKQSKSVGVVMDSAASHKEAQVPSRIELRKMYPLSLRLILKHVFPWLLLLFGVIFFYVWFRSSDDPFPHTGLLGTDISLEYNMALYVGLVILLAKALYAALYAWSYDYYVERGCFFIRKGVILRHTGTYLLSHIADVYLVRSIPDLLFGLHTLKVGTAADRSEQFADIEGLTTDTAQELQRHLLDLAASYHPHR